MYGGFYVLLRHHEPATLWKFVLVNLFQLLQLLSFSFEKSLGEVWKTPSIIKYISQVLSTFRMVYWLERVNWDVYIIVYYVSIFLLFFIIINFIYVAYCYKQRKFPFTWPIPLLKYSCNALVTIKFIPMLELFLKFSSCSTEVTDPKYQDGTLRHKVFPEVQCFQRIHILHVTLSYIVIFIFLTLCYFITSCFYESRLGKSPIAKQHSRAHLTMLASKVLFVFAFNFFSGTSSISQTANEWFLSICLFIGSGAIFASFLLERPYYDAKTQKSVNLMNGFFLWTNSVLLFSCFVKSLDFTGNLPVFLMGSPFVIIIILGLKDERKAYLMKNLAKMDNGSDYQKYINYYLTIVETKEEDRDAAMTLKGYLNHHSEFCTLDDCPLRNFKKQMQNDKKREYGQFGPIMINNQVTMHSAISAVAHRSSVTNLESPALLLSQAKNLYMNGTKRFPECVQLKLDYSYFLLTKMLNKRDSLKELINAEKLRPTLDEAFMIFRFRQIIEDELYDQEGGGGGPNGASLQANAAGSGGLDYVAAINFENHFKLFRGLVDRSATLHLDFWNLLLDDQPDLMRIKDQGTKINNSIQAVDLQWKKVCQQGTPTVKALRLYASYLIEILNDKDMGNEQLVKAKELAATRFGGGANHLEGDGAGFDGIGGEMGMSLDGSPCCFISAEQERLGQIIHCNMSLCKVFGYSKRDALIGHEVEMLMPKLYAQQHKRFLEFAAQKPPDLFSSKERQVFGKHSSGYIFPAGLTIKVVPSYVNGRQFLATFKVEKSGINKNVCYLIVDKNYRLLDASASCINMLDIDLQRLNRIKAKIDIKNHLPFFFQKDFYLSNIKQQGAHIDFYYPVLVRTSMLPPDQNPNNNNGFRRRRTNGGQDGGDMDSIAGAGEYPVMEDGQQYYQGNNDQSQLKSRQTFRRNQQMQLRHQGTDMLSMINEEESQMVLMLDDNNYHGDSQQMLRIRKRSTHNLDRFDSDGNLILNIRNQQNGTNDYEDDDQQQDQMNGTNTNDEEGGGSRLLRYDYLVQARNSEPATYNGIIQEIKFETPNLENPAPGWFIKLETINDKKEQNINTGGGGGGGGRITKSMKQSSFQFSYDAVNKQFRRELRDKENKDIFIDKHYIQMKNIKENSIKQQQKDDSSPIDPKIQGLTYLTYLNRYQKWQMRGGQGDVMETIEADDDYLDEDRPSEDDDDNSHGSRDGLNNNPKQVIAVSSPNTKKSSGTLKQLLEAKMITMKKTRRDTKGGDATVKINPSQATDFAIAGKQIMMDNIDYKKIMAQQQAANQGVQQQSKDYLKSEIERMINVLRKKQEMGSGVHTFRRMEPGVKNSSTAIILGQEGRYEEIQFQVAALFTGRSGEAVEDDSEKDGEDGDKGRNKKDPNSDLKNTIKSRKAFHMALTDKTMPPAIKRLNRAANFLMLCLIALAVVDYSTVYKQLKDTIKNYQVIESSQRRVSEIQKVALNVRTLILLNQGIMQPGNYMGYSSKQELFTATKADMQNSLNELYVIQNEINLSQLKLSEEHNLLLEGKTVNLFFRQDPTKGTMKAIKFSLTEALLQIQSSIFTVGNMLLTEFLPEDGNTAGATGNDDVFFLLYNSYNDLLVAMRKSSDLYVQELVDRTQQKDEVSMIIFILSIVLLVLMILVLIPVVASVNEQKSKVLSLFCEIEDKTVRKLAMRCDRFLFKLQSEDNAEDVESNNDELLMYMGGGGHTMGEGGGGGGFRSVNSFGEEDDEYNGGGGSGGLSSSKNTSSTTKKRAKNLTKTSKLFYLKFVAGILLIEAYYSYQYSQVKEFANVTKIHVTELNLTATVEPYLWFTFNTQREMLYNSTKSITGAASSFRVAQDSIYIMSQLIYQLEVQHIQNSPVLDAGYINNFDNVMRDNLCTQAQQKYYPEEPLGSGLYPKCNNFSSGLATEGMNVIQINQLKLLRLQLSIYQELLISSKQNYTVVKQFFFNWPYHFELYLTQDVFVEPFMRRLVADLNGTLVNGLDTRIQRMLFLLIFFLILLMLAYVSVWIPLVNQLNAQINKTKLMLMIVPIEVLMRMKSVAKVLQSQDLLEQAPSSKGSSGESEPKRSRERNSRSMSRQN